MLKTAKAKSKQRDLHADRIADTAQPAKDRAERLQPAWTTLLFGLAGGMLLWAAFPPLNLPWLAWVAPTAWLWLVRWPQSPGWRSYAALWLAGFVHWLLMLEGIRLAHPALYAGWIALSAYLAVYLPLFVGLTRVAVQRLKVSIIVAAPVVWVGLELVRGYAITGFSMGLLAHTQAEYPRLIQISDLAGGYALSFVIMLVAACLTRMIPIRRPTPGTRHPTPDSRLPTPITWWPVAIAFAAVFATAAYGKWRLAQTPPRLAGPKARVALIQGSLDTVFDASSERMRQTLDHYRALTEQAVQRRNLDLILWPESMFVIPETIFAESGASSAEAVSSPDELRERQDVFRRVLAGEAARANANTDPEHPGTMLLIGTTTISYETDPPRYYNAALLADRTGSVVGRYYKTHPVMFGEYIPFADALPWLYKITPMTGGLSIGDGPKVFEVAGLALSPSVCFESTIPHLIRSQLRDLARRGTPADVLVNVTNDGWFWGTSMLDLHFRCGVFRAVENRKPLLVVANTGISLWVDGNGVVRQRGPRRQPQVLIAEVLGDGRASPYQSLGDWLGWLCAAACAGLALIGMRKARQ